MPGQNILITGRTTYCTDSSGECIPSDPIVNDSVQFNQSGHLRYYESTNLKDTTVVINSPPQIENLEITDVLGEHAYDIRVIVDDVDNQQINCKINNVKLYQLII